MENKNLKTIHTIEKVGKIISMIVFVASIVGVALSVLGIILLAAGVDNFEINNIKIHGIIETNADMSIAELYLALAVGMIYLVANIIVGWFAFRYFKKQLANGTPFTMEGSKRCLVLGIIMAAASLIASTIAGITTLIVQACTKVDHLPTFNIDTTLIIGIVFMILSVIYKYVAETNNQK